MGKLIDPERTKQAREARDRRAGVILEAALSSFERLPYSEVTLDSIGQRAGIKQGQASFAFRSREELFLQVLRRQLEPWYDALDQSLADGNDPLPGEAVADLIASSLADRPTLTRLLGSLHTALELHEDGMQVHTFHRWQRARMLAIAEAVSHRLPGLDPPDAFDLLYRAQLVAAAAHPISRPVGNLAVELMDDEHRVFSLDLGDEVRRVVLAGLPR
jgi:AcrR family transcriptional regulator